MEGIWSLLRSWLRPHRGIAQDKLPLYLAFFGFVHNARRRGKALLGALVAGVIVQLPIVGVIGFALMLAGVLLVLTPGKAAQADATASTSGSARPAPQRKRSSFMDTINERWERRQDGDQGR